MHRVRWPIVTKTKRNTMRYGNQKSEMLNESLFPNSVGGTMSRVEFWKNVRTVQYSKTDNWCTKPVTTSYVVALWKPIRGGTL